MDAYIYRAALYCDECASRIKKDFEKTGDVPEDVEDESTYDSDDYPKGPVAGGGGESDSPACCDDCGEFLENPLTEEGRSGLISLVRDAVTKCECSVVMRQWIDFYEVELSELLPPEEVD